MYSGLFTGVNLCISNRSRPPQNWHSTPPQTFEEYIFCFCKLCTPPSPSFWFKKLCLKWNLTLQIETLGLICFYTFNCCSLLINGNNRRLYALRKYTAIWKYLEKVVACQITFIDNHAHFKMYVVRYFPCKAVSYYFFEATMHEIDTITLLWLWLPKH